MGDFRATDIFGGGLRNVIKQSNVREQDKQDRLDELAKEERGLKATLAKEDRSLQRELNKEQRAADKDAADKLESTIFGVKTLDKHRDSILSAVPEDKRDLLGAAIDRSKDSIASGSGNLEGEFDDLQSMVKGFNSKGNEFERKVLKASNPELYAKIVGEETAAKVASQVAAQKGKAQEQLERDYLRVQSVVDTTMDGMFDFGEEQLEKVGTTPGAYLGIIDKMTPKQWNRYKAAVEGSGREASGTVGRFLIPGARGASLTTIFAKSTAEVGNTIEGNASNIAFTKGNLLAAAISTNIMDIDSEGKIRPIQDIIIDPVTGKKMSELPNKDKVRVMNEMKHKFIRETERHIETQAFLRNPKLLQNSTIVNLTKNAPVFNSPDDVKKAVRSGIIMPGTLVKLKTGDLGVAR